MANENNKVITLICERAADVNNLIDANGDMKDVNGLSVVKLPCSGMIQPLMIERAMKAGAAGVIVCGCQIGDCYYREGNKHIRERLLGERTPGLKKTVDRRRVLALWLSRVQTQRFVSEAKEFVAYVRGLEPLEAAKPAAAPQPKPAPAATAPKPEPPAAQPAKETTVSPAEPAAPSIATEADKPNVTVIKPKEDSPPSEGTSN